VLTKQEAFNGTFVAQSSGSGPAWPARPSHGSRLRTEACSSAAFDWEARRRAAENLWDRSPDREPAMGDGRH
jgi:hypothetical protein